MRRDSIGTIGPIVQPIPPLDRARGAAERAEPPDRRRGLAQRLPRALKRPTGSPTEAQGLLVEHDNPVALAAAIVRLLTDHALADTLRGPATVSSTTASTSR
jgi:hypothetical protein